MRRRKASNETDALDAVVYAYGGAVPLEGWEEAQEEVARQRALWNRLVEIDRDHERRLWEVAGRDVPAIAELAEQIATISAHFDALVAERRDLRRAARRRVATPELDARIDAAAKARRAARRKVFVRLRESTTPRLKPGACEQQARG